MCEGTRKLDTQTEERATTEPDQRQARFSADRPTEIAMQELANQSEERGYKQAVDLGFRRGFHEGLRNLAREVQFDFVDGEPHIKSAVPHVS